LDSSKFDVELLAFSPEKQKAVVGHALYDEKFFGQIINTIEPSWFSDVIVFRTYSGIKKWYGIWKRRPTPSELLDSQAMAELDPREINQARLLITTMKEARHQYTTEPLLAEMETWIKARLVQNTLPKAAQAFNGKDTDSAIRIMNQMVKEYHDVRFREDGELKFDDYSAELIASQTASVDGLTFGLPGVDRLLQPNGSGGGLLPGQMSLLLAASNVGKTSTLVTLACHNIRQGKSVLFIFHEGTPEELKLKFMSCMSGLTPPEQLRAYASPETYPSMKAVEALLQRFLVLKPMFKAGLTVEEVAANVDKFQDIRAMTTGKGFDLFIDDYGAMLYSGQNARGHMQPRQVIEDVYKNFVQMGLQYKFHVLSAIQTNREGSKVNRKVGSYQDDMRLLQMEDVMEAWGPMTAASNVISLNRTVEDANANKITMHGCKSRGGETGWSVVCNTNYNVCRTHGNNMGYFWYKGTDALTTPVAKNIAKTFNGELVPAEKLDLYRQL